MANDWASGLDDWCADDCDEALLAAMTAVEQQQQQPAPTPQSLRPLALASGPPLPTNRVAPAKTTKQTKLAFGSTNGLRSPWVSDFQVADHPPTRQPVSMARTKSQLSRPPVAPAPSGTRPAAQRQASSPSFKSPQQQPAIIRPTQSRLAAPAALTPQMLERLWNGSARLSSHATVEHPQATCHHPYDASTIRESVYPINYPKRDYQFAIVQKALARNTLVALPTGLGKTFIAAVVMFNFYRWFPQGKVIFMAPTKPLVAQQIGACYDYCGMPLGDTVELTGSQDPASRVGLWQTKRVFFLTPQVMQNDIQREVCPASEVVCLVVDEAHRAQGNQAYCEVIRELAMRNSHFRILALTATPGHDMETVQRVVENLRISHIELRTEESADIVNYIHGRSLEAVRVPFNDTMREVRADLLGILSTYVEDLRRLGCAIFCQDLTKLTHYQIHIARGNFRSGLRNDPSKSSLAGRVEGLLGVASTLSRAMQLLNQHGIRSSFSHIDSLRTDVMDPNVKSSRAKRDMVQGASFQGFYKRMADLVADPRFVGHPKLERLSGILLEHFAREQAQDTSTAPMPETDALETNRQCTRVIIFSQYRESVDEIVRVLSEHEPLIRVMSFVGQSSGKSGKGLSQRQQLEIIRKFKSGNYNTLVATCIGEEGLDIGEVDLIVCYDSQGSPIRLLQRMGRTGRKRRGRIVVLLSEGGEEQLFEKSQQAYRRVQEGIISGRAKLQYFPDNPRMLPEPIVPQCVEKTIDIAPRPPVTPKTPKRKFKHLDDEANGDTRASWVATETKGNKAVVTSRAAKRTQSATSASAKAQLSAGLDPVQWDGFHAKYSPLFNRPPDNRLSLMDQPSTMGQPPSARFAALLRRTTPWQTSLSAIHRIGHSTRTHTMVALAQQIDHWSLNAKSALQTHRQTVQRRVNFDLVSIAKTVCSSHRLPATVSPSVNSTSNRTTPCPKAIDSMGASDAPVLLSDDSLDELLPELDMSTLTFDFKDSAESKLAAGTSLTPLTHAATSDLPVKAEPDPQTHSTVNTPSILPTDPASPPRKQLLFPFEDPEYTPPPLSAYSFPLTLSAFRAAVRSSKALEALRRACSTQLKTESKLSAGKADNVLQSPVPVRLSSPPSQPFVEDLAWLSDTELDLVLLEAESKVCATLPTTDTMAVDSSMVSPLPKADSILQVEMTPPKVPDAMCPPAFPVTISPSPVIHQGCMQRRNVVTASPHDTQPDVPAMAGPELLGHSTPLSAQRQGLATQDSVVTPTPPPFRVRRRFGRIDPSSPIAKEPEHFPELPVKTARRRLQLKRTLSAQNFSGRPSHRSAPNQAAPKRQRTKSTGSRTNNPFLDMDAELSGSGHSSEELNEEALLSQMSSFITDGDGEGELTTASQDTVGSPINMQAVYRQSLFSPDSHRRRQQMFGRHHSAGPLFHTRPGQFGHGAQPRFRMKLAPQDLLDRLEAQYGTPSEADDDDDDDGEDEDEAGGTIEMTTSQELAQLRDAMVDDIVPSPQPVSRLPNRSITVPSRDYSMPDPDTPVLPVMDVDPIDTSTDTSPEAAKILPSTGQHDAPGFPLASLPLRRFTSCQSPIVNTSQKSDVQPLTHTRSLASVRQPVTTAAGRVPVVTPPESMDNAEALLSNPHHLPPTTTPKPPPMATKSASAASIPAPVVVVDPRELRTSIASMLSCQFNLKTVIRSLREGQYIISRRMGVKRKSRTELITAVANGDLVQETQFFRAAFDNPVLVIEQADDESMAAATATGTNKSERGKAEKMTYKKATAMESMFSTRQYDQAIEVLLRMNLKLFFSTGRADTARLLYQLVTEENTIGPNACFRHPGLIPSKDNQFLKFLITLPGVSDVVAYNILSAGFGTLREIINCDPDELMLRVPYLDRKRAQAIVTYLH
ncbi:3'-5' DNA helicase [Dimargaris xerosporica]|nr:3'-5' DNA helicase [Dimargaris xerosporica]